MTAFTAGRMYVVFMWDPRVILFIYVYVFSCALYETQAVNDRCVCVSSFFFFFSWLLLCMRTWTTFGSCQRHKWCPTNTSFFFFCLIYPSRLASALSFTLLYPRLYTIVPQQTNSVLGTHTRIHARAWINVKKLLFYLFLLFSWAEAKAYFIFFLLSKKKKKNRSLFFDESCKASQKEAASFVRFILLTCKIEFNDISLLYFVYLSVFFFFLRTSLFVFVWSVTGGKK